MNNRCKNGQSYHKNGGNVEGFKILVPTLVTDISGYLLRIRYFGETVTNYDVFLTMARPPDKFRSRLKQLLGIKRSPNDSRSPQLPPSSVEEPVFCDELLKEIGKGNSQASRARILKELCEVVAAKQLEEHAVEALWLAVEDLLYSDVSTEVRHITLQFLTSLVSGQYGTLKLLRAHFFRVIQNHNIPEDLTHRLHFLKALTAEGKEILYFEEQIGPFLLSWMPDVILGERSDIFLPLLRNFIRYNASYLDEEVVSGLVKQTCQMSNTTDKETDVEHALAVLDAVIRYSSLPSTALYSFVVAVCNTVNVEKFCEPSWRLMRHLLGTHLGHNGVLTMCYILEDSNNWKKFSLLRGAIFFVGMCLWGSKRVATLKHKPIAVLPSFYKVLSCGNENVICEVTLSMQRLVKKYGAYQHVVAWESILDITVALQEYVERHPSYNAVSDNFHILVSYIEELHEKHQFNGSSDKLFGIVERCTSTRPESSVILLVSHRAQSLHPYCDNWFGNIKDLMEKYFKCEERTLVRIKVLDVLSNILGMFSHLFEEEILEHSVLPYLDGIAKDQDLAVRTRAVQLLVDVIEASDSLKALDVMNIIEKVAQCPVDPLKRYVKPCHHGQSNDQLQDEKVLEDIKEAVLGLVRLFKVKLFRQPQSHAERIFNIMVSHIKAHYVNGYRTYIASQIRLAILECLLSLRADSCQRLGIVQNGDSDIKFSSYFGCADKKSISDEKTQQSGLAFIPYSEAMNVILMCLQQEWEWEVLDIVLRIFPETLQDKNLILSGKQYLNSICSVLCKMVSNYDFLPGLCRVPHDMRRLHLYGRIFPVLTELSTYHPFIDQEQQFCIVRTMEIGLVSSSAALCVSCLTICMLEIPYVMTCLLPTFLQCFVKLSPTPQVALPLLEFLSALSHMRDLYSNFTTDQFKCVFGICLPYTNSSRYSQYTVTLAHHVVGSWYVHCPLLLRKQFASYIIKTLKETEMSSMTPPPYLKLPSSPKKPQSSPAFSQNVAENEDASMSLTAEMVEITVDMMAKYTFSSSLTQPKRTAVVEQLLGNGTSRSWLLDNVLVTVTVCNRPSSNLACVYCSSTFAQSSSRREPGSEVESGMGDYSKTTGLKVPDENVSHEYGSVRRRHGGFDGEALSHPDDTGNKAPTTSGTCQPARTRGDDGTTSSSGIKTMTESRNSSDEKESGVLEEPRATADQCTCVCQGWAEFLIRRATGNTSWIMRLQNRPKLAGSFSSTQRLGDQMCPEIYESVIPKAFFDELSTDLQEELDKQKFSSSMGLLSESADSDTLVVDIVPNDKEEDVEQECHDRSSVEDDVKDEQVDRGLEGTEDSKVSNDDGTLNVSEEIDVDKSTTDDSTQKVKFYDNQDGKTSPSSSPITSPDSSERLNLAASFLERTRLLSRSPMDGPSAFMLLESGESSKRDLPLRDVAERSDDDLASQQEFEKPIVGKSPLDASPIKSRFYQEDSGGEEDSELDVNISEDDQRKDFSQNQEETQGGFSAIHVSTDTSEIRPVHHTSTPEPTNSLPGSRTQSPLTGVSRCHRISESSGGSSSLPTSPLVSPKRRERSPEFFVDKSVRRQSRNDEERFVSGPGVNIRGTIVVPEKRDAVMMKSATVDIGMLRRISSSPEIIVPIKERRGIMKFFDSGGDKNEKEKKIPVLLRRQTMSGTQLPNVNREKRRSFSGPFPDLATKGQELHAENARSSSDAMSPNFIFLQFYHSSWFGTEETPLALPEEEFFHRAVKNLDRIPSYDTHKFGVIYVGPNQETDEVAILRNLYGSVRYMNFLSGLGELIRLRDCSLSEVYTGGLDRNGADGEYAYNWTSDIAQIIFHVATLMPNKDKDPNCHCKKLHIGNDFVTIVYNDSKANYKMGTIKGQFNFVEIVIKPLDNETNVITLSIKDELKDILTDTNRGPRVISDKNLPTLVRHIALHVNMASVIHQSQKTPTDAYGCNWLQRLRQLKRIQTRVASPTESQGASGSLGRNTRKDLHNIVDFTEFVLQ